MDGELKEAGFTELQVPKDFKGIPDEVLLTLERNKTEAAAVLEEIQTERRNFAETHKDELYRLLQIYSIGSQIYSVENSLESTEFVYRITGWIRLFLLEK